MKNENNTLNAILSAIETLEAKQWNFTITFEEEDRLHKLIELAESMTK